MTLKMELTWLPAAILKGAQENRSEIESQNGNKRAFYYYFFEWSLKDTDTLRAKNSGISSWKWDHNHWFKPLTGSLTTLQDLNDLKKLCVGLSLGSSIWLRSLKNQARI